jgi:hypothetical protein
MKNLILFLMITLALTARAEEEKATNNPERPAAEPKAPVKPTSASRRAELQWGLVGQLGNITVGNRAMTGSGAGIYYYLSGHDVMTLEAGAGTNYDFTSSVVGDTVNGRDRRVGVYYKKFTGNTLYFKTGLQADHVDYKVTHYPLFLGPTTTQEASIDLYSLYLGIGNHWQIKQFTIGCDWAAVVVPIAHANYSETNSAPASSDNWDLKKRLTAVGGVVTRFYVGVGF